MSTYRMWFLSLGGFLLVAGPLSAQAPADAPLKMVIAVWPDTNGAKNTMKHMSKGAKDKTEAYAVLVKNQDGMVEARERYHNPRSGGAGVQASDIIDRATARVSAPTSGADSASGYGSSEKPSQLSPEDLQRIQAMFGPGESALMLLSQAPAMDEIKRTLGLGAQRNTEIVELSVQE